jgi:hypothetical protein
MVDFSLLSNLIYLFREISFIKITIYVIFSASVKNARI